MAILLTKVIQNIANHIVVAEKGKGEFMTQVTPYVARQIAAMTDWCLEVAEKGEELMLG